MQLDHVPFVDDIISLHPLPVEFSRAPDPCISKLGNEILMNREGHLFHRAPFLQNDGVRQVRFLGWPL